LSGSLANTRRYYRDVYNLIVVKINEKDDVRVGGESAKIELVMRLNSPRVQGEAWL